MQITQMDMQYYPFLHPAKAMGVAILMWLITVIPELWK